MQCRMVELRCKEVINICDGSRLGYVGDVEVILPEGKVAALGVHQAGGGRYHPHRQAPGETAPLPGPAAEAEGALLKEKTGWGLPHPVFLYSKYFH